MQAYSLDMLIDYVNGTMQLANPTSLKIGVIIALKSVHAQVGVVSCRYVENEEIKICEGKYRIPDKVIDVDAVYSNPQTSRKGNYGVVVGHGVRSGQRLAYRKDLMELQFPNHYNGSAYMAYYTFYYDERGNILIPEAMIDACEKYCTYYMLQKSNNRKNPKWQERMIMKQDAMDAIRDARGRINRTSTDTFNTLMQ